MPSKSLPSLLGVRLKIRRAGEQRPKHFEIACIAAAISGVKSFCHDRHGPRVYEALRCFPLLLQRCNQQRCPALGIMPV
jgi:hypothetical protein